MRPHISCGVYTPQQRHRGYRCVCTYTCSSAELQLPTSYLYAVNTVYLRMAHIGTDAYRLLDADISHIRMWLHVSACWASAAIFTCVTGTKVQILTQTALRRWKQIYSLTIDGSTAIYAHVYSIAPVCRRRAAGTTAVCCVSAVSAYCYSYVYASYLLPCVYTYSYSHQPTEHPYAPTEHTDSRSYIRIRIAAGRQTAFA